MFKYSFWIKTTLREPLRSQKKVFQRQHFGNTSHTDFVFARNEFLRLFGDPHQSLILIVIYYMFKYSFGIKTTLLESLRSQKKYFKGYISAKLVIRT